MDINQFHDNSPEKLLPVQHGDKLIRINISRNTLIAFVLSILLHAIALLFVLPQIQLVTPTASSSQTIEVSLAPPKQADEVVAEEVLPEPPLAEPEPIEPVKKPKPKTKVIAKKPVPDEKPPTFSIPDVLATNKPTPEIIPPKETVNKEAPTDMMAYVNQQRAKRQASETNAVQQNAEAVAKEIGLSEDEKRNQRISKNLQGGAGGTFTLTSMSGRRATISFNGWVNNLSNQKQQFFEIEANPGQDLKLLVVKRVISFIRESYQGDFPWESRRLGKEITLSARLEDNGGLEDFLMTEFFGANYKS